MGSPVHKAIWHLRVKRGLYISKEAERYALTELEEDLFPYGFLDGADDDVIIALLWFLDKLDANEIDICGSYEERTLKRYEALKEDYLCLLRMMNENEQNDDVDHDLPF
jgi:hypothetical protein